MTRLIFLLTLAVGASTTQAIEPPGPYTATYRVAANGLTLGKMERTLRRKDDGYVLETEMYTTGFAAMLKPYRLEERSVWKIEQERLIPQHYELHSRSGREKTERLEFDWSRGLLLTSRNGKERTLPLHPGVTDKLAYQVLLRRDLAAGRKQTRYDVAEWHRIRTYRFQVMGTERVRTPAGTFDALKVERIGDKDDERVTIFWVAEALDYMLVRIVQDDDGNTLASDFIGVTAGEPEAASP